MRAVQIIRWMRVERWRQWAVAGVLLVGLSGCPAMMASKKKPLLPQDHFSCGEKMPERISAAPASRR